MAPALKSLRSPMARRRTAFLLPAIALLCAAVGSGFSTAAVKLDQLRLPPGFSIEVLVDDVPNARQLALSDGGTLFVGTRRAGVVYAIANALSAPAPARTA